MKKNIPKEYHYTNYLHPRYWITWLGIGIMFLMSLLPNKAQMWLGTQLGTLMYKQGGIRLTITRTNIKACFPELTPEQQEELVLQSFIANMKGMVETTIAWWGDHQPILDNLEVHGLEHLKEAEGRGKGVVLMGGHFSILDLAGPMVNSVFDFNYMYRPNDNPLFNAIIERHRMRYSHEKFSKHELTAMMDFIKQGNTVWYGYDQDFGARRSVFAPFFGVQTATVKAAMRLTRNSEATVLMVSQFRESDGHYSIRFSPIFEDLAKDDDVTAATRLNAQLESFIRVHPEQYLWMHRRFRSRPEGEAPFYPKKQRKKKKKST
ncbi:MAG: KDO2-lipid IV(A) lauroyltransferase [Oleispira sp.]|jgi:KDO2-lipid IV(A) lauroyltransferase